MKQAKSIFALLCFCMALTGCNAMPEKSVQTISFLAFGDGGYCPAYPKPKLLLKPLNQSEFIQQERADWLEDYRPIEEFEYPPMTYIPGTRIVTEKSGAKAVGKAMSTLCQQRDCQFAIQLGDNIYPDGADANDGKDDQKRMDDLILAPLKPLFAQQPKLTVYSALGNHDWKSSRKGVAQQIAWMNEQANFHIGKKGYYSYKVGQVGNDVEFFVLDTNMLLAGQTFYEFPLNPDGSEQNEQAALAMGMGELEQPEPHESPVDGEDKRQLNWLIEGLKQSKAKWKIVYGHHILWSIGGTKYSEGHVLRRLLMPTLCQFADAYVAGHEHDLELLTDDCSIATPTIDQPELPLIISGAASKMRGKHTPFAEQQEKRYTQYNLVWSKSFTWGFAHIEIDNLSDQLKVTFFSTPQDGSGRLIEEQQFSFQHRSID